MVLGFGVLGFGGEFARLASFTECKPSDYQTHPPWMRMVKERPVKKLWLWPLQTLITLLALSKKMGCHSRI